MTNADLDTNNILDVRRRAVKAQAVQFTGKNGREVVAFVRESGEEAQNRGSYVSVVTDASSDRVKKGDWVVKDADDAIRVFKNDQFNTFFLIKK